MPRKSDLTWQKGAANRKGRWKKWYKGKAHYFAHGESRSDAEGYRRAYEAWKKKKAEIDAEEAQRPKPYQEDYERTIDEWTLVLQWSLEHDDERHVCIAREKIRELRGRLAQKKPRPVTDDDRLWSRFRWPEEVLKQAVAPLATSPPPDPKSRTTIVPGPMATTWLDGSPQRIAEEVWRDRIESQRNQAKEPELTIGANVDAYLAGKEGQVRAGELTAGRYVPLKLHLHDFRDWLGAQTDVSAIAGKFLADYHAELMQRIGVESPDSDSPFKPRRKLSADYARDRISAVKTFVRWLYETEVIPTLPRILTNKKSLTISKRLDTPETFTIAEVKALLAAATSRTKLYILLMLNCGMYQGDIANLKQTEVDWKAGRITRKRSKTRKKKGVPTVKYLLWHETFELLKAERAPEGDVVLVNERGGPLKVEELDAEGKLRKIDNVTTAFSRLRRKTKIDKSLKVFRKTSATLIRSEKGYTGLADLFLGLAPSSVADRHYADAPQALLDEAIQWLGKQYGAE